jgi:4,5-dihydroxyphthalate decarboxylase
MSTNIPLTLACGDYESIRALKEGSVKIDGVDLTVLTDMDSASRHWRMIRGGEFDVAELSLSSYLMAADRGQPFAAIPVYLHRRFRHGFIFINADAGISRPTDLIGKRIGVKTFQATAILWLRGMLEHEYGVPHRDVTWVVELDEDVPFEPHDGLVIEPAPPGKQVEWMLAEGEIDAVLHPDLIDPILQGDARVRRLFDDYQAEEQAYFERTGIFPIMHVTAIRRELVDAHPWLPTNLMRAFEASKAACTARLENPRIVPLAWYRHYLDREREILGPDPWQYGLGDDNRKNLETAIMYSHDCGLISRRLSPDEIFLDPTSGRGRGGKRI